MTLLTEYQAEDILREQGVHICVRTLRSYRYSENEIMGPVFYKIGKLVRYRQRDLLRWIASGRQA